jgi:GTP-binding protein
MRKPLVALVGRPNVGKSTLFNRLSGERLAVVNDIPGTTRDRLLAEAEWSGYVFDVVDTGGIDPTTVKIGAGRQPLSVDSADFISEIRSQAEVALEEADAVLFITDVESGVTPADVEVADILRRYQGKRDGQPWPPLYLVVNKCDSQKHREEVYPFYELGMGEVYPISALHGIGVGDLLDEVVANFDERVSELEEDDSVKIAIVGKPNVGKSSLLNRLLGKERAIVSPIAGTTRDAVDSFLSYDDIPLTLIDTAGIRKRGKIEPGVEKYSVIRSHRAIERADVALLMVDATTGMTVQDTHIAGFILDYWKSAVVIVNKWDAIEKDSYTMDTFSRQVRHALNFMDYVPVLYISALTGQRVNQVLQSAQDRHPAPSKAGRHLKIYYGTQVRSDPPTFLIYVNYPKLAHFTYIRFLENRIRERYPFLGTPIRIVLKARSRP